MAKASPKRQITQSEKFKAIAKELGTDSDEKTFDAALKRLATAKPSKKSKSNV